MRLPGPPTVKDIGPYRQIDSSVMNENQVKRLFRLQIQSIMDAEIICVPTFVNVCKLLYVYSRQVLGWMHAEQWSEKFPAWQIQPYWWTLAAGDVWPPAGVLDLTPIWNQTLGLSHSFQERWDVSYNFYCYSKSLPSSSRAPDKAICCLDLGYNNG